MARAFPNKPSFIYTASVILKMVSRCVNENQSLKPRKNNSGRKKNPKNNSLITGRNLEETLLLMTGQIMEEDQTHSS